MQAGGFLRRPSEEIVIHIKLADLPDGIKPAIASRFYAGTTTARADAISYQIDSVKHLGHLADYIEIRGTRN